MQWKNKKVHHFYKYPTWSKPQWQIRKVCGVMFGWKTHFHRALFLSLFMSHCLCLSHDAPALDCGPNRELALVWASVISVVFTWGGGQIFPTSQKEKPLQLTSNLSQSSVPSGYRGYWIVLITIQFRWIDRKENEHLTRMSRLHNKGLFGLTAFNVHLEWGRRQRSHLRTLGMWWTNWGHLMSPHQRKRNWGNIKLWPPHWCPIHLYSKRNHLWGLYRACHLLCARNTHSQGQKVSFIRITPELSKETWRKKNSGAQNIILLDRLKRH